MMGSIVLDLRKLGANRSRRRIVEVVISGRVSILVLMVFEAG